MVLARPALAALLIGLALLASPALLLQFQEPAECANAVDPASADDIEPAAGTFQYEELSATAQRAFDTAQSADSSVIVTGERCPAEFSYTAQQRHYEIVKNGSTYHLTTFANDLIPEVSIAAGLLAFLGGGVIGIAVSTADAPAARFPLWVGAVGGATLVGVAAAVILDQRLWLAIGGTGIVTALTLVGAGAALPPRRALLFGGALTVLPGIVALPLLGVSVVLLIPAVFPLLLVGLGLGGRTITTSVLG